MPRFDLESEFPTIMDAALENGLRPEEAMFLLAVRHAENGSPGFEFGVKRAKGSNLRVQAGWAASSIVKNRPRFDEYLRRGGNPNYAVFFAQHGGPAGHGWAPIEGVPSEESKLNMNWPINVESFLSDNVSLWMPRIREWYDENEKLQAIEGKNVQAVE